ncbi:Hypothetical protein SSCIU_01457 [Mammaliicoccus sciuri]|nr:Hypothetical protein SSCIU_01457 [Mammaliicoccus sciuri]
MRNIRRRFYKQTTSYITTPTLNMKH